MSPSVMRNRTARELRRARSTYGDGHPATWAAYGRAIAAWGSAVRLRALAPAMVQTIEPRSSTAIELLNIANTASARALRPGFENRHSRRRRAA